MAMTSEQEAAIKAIQDPGCDFLKVTAISGAGKTTTLVNMAQAINPESGLYLAYNKAIA